MKYEHTKSNSSGNIGGWKIDNSLDFLDEPNDPIGCDSCVFKKIYANQFGDWEECSHILRRNFGWRLPEDRDCPLWKDKDKLSIL